MARLTTVRTCVDVLPSILLRLLSSARLCLAIRRLHAFTAILRTVVADT